MAETEDKVKVKFLRDEVYETEGRNQGKRFVEGRVYSMTPDMAQRWVRRDAAELVDETPEDEGEEPPKPRRGRPPKARPEEAGDGDESDEDDEPVAPTPPKEPPAKLPEPNPAAKPPEAKPPETAGPGPRFVAQPQQPAKAPDKGR